MASGGVRRIEAVVNVASGGVGADAPARLEKILSDRGLSANICAPETGDLEQCLRKAVDADPDVVIVLAGDGTARAAAQMAGPKGPAIAPLPGGTMNMLPHAVYGLRDWPEALELALEHGVEERIGGGEVDGRVFLVAGIFGSPALWALAREAARYHQPRLAWLRARRAMRRAFSGRLRYSLDEGPRRKAEALICMCPLRSRVLPDDAATLEAAAMDVQGASDVLRLGLHAAMGHWRDDPNVTSETCHTARIWAARRIPAVLDGEPVTLNTQALVRYRPDVARVLAAPKEMRKPQ